MKLAFRIISEDNNLNTFVEHSVRIGKGTRKGAMWDTAYTSDTGLNIRMVGVCVSKNVWEKMESYLSLFRPRHMRFRQQGVMHDNFGFSNAVDQIDRCLEDEVNPLHISRVKPLDLATREYVDSIVKGE